MLPLGGNNPYLIPVPTGSQGNLHKGYVEAIVPPLKSEFSFASDCVSVVHLFL